MPLVRVNNGVKTLTLCAMSLSLSDNSREWDGRATLGESVKDACGVSLTTQYIPLKHSTASF